MIKIYFDTKQSLYLYLKSILKYKGDLIEINKDNIGCYAKIDDRDYDAKELLTKAKNFVGYLQFSRQK